MKHITTLLLFITCYSVAFSQKDSATLVAKLQSELRQSVMQEAQVHSVKLPWLDRKPASGIGKIALHAGIIIPGIAAGIAQGQLHVTENNKWGYRARHPNARETWWNSDSSWRYANGNNFVDANFLVVFRDKRHFNEMIATVTISTQMGFVALLSIDDIRRHKKPKIGKMLLYIVEANVVRLLAKRATIEYYNVF